MYGLNQTAPLKRDELLSSLVGANLGQLGADGNSKEDADGKRESSPN